MKNEEIMIGDVCSPELCDIILDEVISLLKNTSIKGGNREGIINTIKKVGSKKTMVLWGYEEKKLIEFIIADTKLELLDYMHIKITFNNEADLIRMKVVSNLSNDTFLAMTKYE